MSRFNHDNGYYDGNTKLSLGNYITIQDGTYNTQWMIAGFDVEYNKVAADGTTFDNGYGIGLVPRTYVTTGKFSASTYDVDRGYTNCTVHTQLLPTICNALGTVLGSHLISRRVLLSNGTDGGRRANSYTWTNTKATLMSAYQVTGLFGYNSGFDVGEANYKLPVFDHMDYSIVGSNYCLRGIWGTTNSYDRLIWTITSNGSIDRGYMEGTWAIRPFIYIR